MRLTLLIILALVVILLPDESKALDFSKVFDKKESIIKMGAKTVKTKLLLSFYP